MYRSGRELKKQTAPTVKLDLYNFNRKHELDPSSQNPDR